jgi:hypothetical protein
MIGTCPGAQRKEQPGRATCRTVLLHGLVEQRHRPGHDVVASQRHGPGPGLPVELLRQRRVPREGAVRRATEPLRPQRPRQAPRPPPRPLQRTHGAPRGHRAQHHQRPRERRLRVAAAPAADNAGSPHGRPARRGGGCRLELARNRVLLDAGASRVRSAAEGEQNVSFSKLGA